MAKVTTLPAEIGFCAFPFVVVAPVCYFALGTASRDVWEPAFFGFLPIAFLYMSFALYITRSEIRALRATVVALGGSAEPNIGAAPESRK